MWTSVGTLVGTRKRSFMVTFYIRKPPEGLERIYVRITVRRGMQFRFFTGWVLPLNARWDNQRGRIGTSRRTDLKMLNAQLARMGEYIERKDMLALSSNRIRDKDFYRSVLNEFKGVQETKKEETPGTLKTYKTCPSGQLRGGFISVYNRL